jgi:hypothetical protein
MKSHRFDLLSFVFGVLFLLMAAAAVWDPSFRWDLGAWLVPAAVLTLGIGLLVSTIHPHQASGNARRLEEELLCGVDEDGEE